MVKMHGILKPAQATKDFYSSKSQQLENKSRNLESVSLEATIKPPKPEFQGFSQELTKAVPASFIQPKLVIGAQGDRYEQEADRVASDVVQKIHAPHFANQSESIQRQDKEKIQPKLNEAIASSEATPDLESAIQSRRGSGQPLTDTIRKPMEQAFGADFSGVKVHTDLQSDQLNKSIQAKAFTTGNDIFFKHGAYSPSSRSGQELLAHELTHVVQQTGNNVQSQSEGRQIENVNVTKPQGLTPMVQKVTEEQGLAAAKKILLSKKGLSKTFGMKGTSLTKSSIDLIEKKILLKLSSEEEVDVDEAAIWQHEKIKDMAIEEFQVWLTNAIMGISSSSPISMGVEPTDKDKEAYKDSLGVPQGFYHVIDSESEAIGLFTNGAATCSAVALYAESIESSDKKQKEIYAVAHIDASNLIGDFIKEMIDAMKAKGGGAIGPIEGVVSTSALSLDTDSGKKQLSDMEAKEKDELAKEQAEQVKEESRTYKYVIPLLKKHGVTISGIGKEGEVWMGKGYKSKTGARGVPAMPLGLTSKSLVKSLESVEGIKAGIEACLIMQKDQGVSGISKDKKHEHKDGINKQMGAFLDAISKLPGTESGKLEGLKEFIKANKDEIQQTTEGKEVVKWAEKSDVKLVE